MSQIDLTNMQRVVAAGSQPGREPSGQVSIDDEFHTVTMLVFAVTANA